MEEFRGNSVSSGVALGNIAVFAKEESEPEKKSVEDTDKELKRLNDALNLAKKELENLYNDAIDKVGEENALIFDIHKMMLEDLDYIENIEGLIKDEGVNAEYAVFATGELFSKTFADMDDEYMKARSVDVIDVSKRVIRKLTGKAEVSLESSEPVIILAEDLTPGETINLDKSKVLAFVTKKGSSNSHTAILARSMNIPALVNVDFNLEDLSKFNGKFAIADAAAGKFYVEPVDEIIENARKLEAELDSARAELNTLKGLENVTKDGRKINIFANIGSEKDVDAVIENDAGGIGLFRSEFLYLGRDQAPGEAEQFESYKEAIVRMAGKKVIIRTLDIGADKKVDYLGLVEEENPALGYRAIRICLNNEGLFKTQLRALYRASAFGNAGIMFPMITSVDEVRRIKEIAGKVREELILEGKEVGSPELGIMIETPASALISDELAKEVDFFSIGTNDLTQYTLAVDRQNEKLGGFYKPHHKAILSLIKMTCDNAHKNGIWVGICGELAGDLELTETFVDMGIDELSVSPSKVLSLRKAVRNI
ncbi:MAG: phosphoenolpyruvate--protein phosphotransferase [Catonella sp.]|uniref:phosphoenolpyruvate--protein phosphotransferase n=1 Tax=Catonella sp. TaxID=2382125 RepID=UPI003FA00216